MARHNRLAWLAALAAAGMTAAPGQARQRHGVPLPFPEILHPDQQPMLPEGFSLTQPLPAADAGSGPINLPRAIPARLARCWSAPGSQAGKALAATVRMSFRVDGSLIGPVMFSYVNAPPGSVMREDVTSSIRDAINGCTPLPFTAGLGSAIAGRLFTIRFVSNPKPDRKETPL